MKADSDKVGRLLRTARGQIDGVLKMMDEGRYCIDVAGQVLAAQAVLRRANREIIRAHLEGCVAEAFATGDEAARARKIDEVADLLDKMSK